MLGLKLTHVSKMGYSWPTAGNPYFPYVQDVSKFDNVCRTNCIQILNRYVVGTMSVRGILVIPGGVKG